MDLTSLIAALSRPAAYPYAVARVKVHQTHISVVFLAGEFVYKIKKPVDLGFLDFSTLAKRRHFCEEEVRLNRRLAPWVYLGVVPVIACDEGPKFEGEGEAVEWAVKMVRLLEENTLLERLRRGAVDAALVEALARHVAAFHARAEIGADCARFGSFEVVAQNARENFSQAEPHVGTTLSRSVFERLRLRTESALARRRPLIEARARRGVPRDTHGDLHLDHVYFFPEKAPAEQLVVIDCIEFNERFRFADPVADLAFLVMDFIFHGRRDLAGILGRAYFQKAGDEEGQALLPFYTAYRACVRGKVEGIELFEKEIPEPERRAALIQARAHWLLALGKLEDLGRRPCLVLVGGLPGSGKSSLARALADRANFSVIRSDVVRKELAGQSSGEPAPAAFGAGIYTPEWTERTYAECLRRAEEMLFEGKRVLVDASFVEEHRRRTFLEAAVLWGVPAVFLCCRADPDTVRERLAGRRGDASDAGWDVYQQAADRWEEPGTLTRSFLRDISTEGSQEQVLEWALVLLHDLRLCEVAGAVHTPDEQS